MIVDAAYAFQEMAWVSSARPFDNLNQVVVHSGKTFGDELRFSCAGSAGGKRGCVEQMLESFCEGMSEHSGEK